MSEYQALKAQVAALQQMVEALQQELRLLRNGKNSDTSHTPPSHQTGAPNAKSLRLKPIVNPADSPDIRVQHCTSEKCRMRQSTTCRTIVAAADRTSGT